MKKNKIENGAKVEPRLMTQFTKEALERQLVELEERLRNHQQETGEAVDKGDEYHDNFAFEEASRKVDMTGSQIFQMKQKLQEVAIIEPRQEVDSIGVGNSVVVRFAGEPEDETFTLLGPDDAVQTKPGWISYESPLGQELMGKKAGDEIEYQTSGNSPHRVKIKMVLPGTF